jgi:cell division protein FtsQ
VRKVKQIALWGVIIIYLFVVSGFISIQQHNTVCNKVKVIVTDSTSRRFIRQGDIRDILKKNKKICIGDPLNKINTNDIEQMVLSNTIIKDCKVFTTVDGKINIEVNQREPIVRIIDGKGQSYYLDMDGSIINKSRRFTPRLLVVNGNIRTPFSLNKVENIFDKRFDKTAIRLRDIYTLANFINNDDFWNAQIEQLYVNSKGEFEMIPRVGPHIIILGDIEDYKAKFDKLWLFYNEGLNYVGWNQYQKINLKYKDQVVCTKTE